jgi:predicted Zn-dependent protease
VKGAAGLKDVAATVADLLGLAEPMPGASLRERWLGGRNESPPIVPSLYAETMAPALDFGWSDLRAWRAGRYKYIRAPRPELYDLEGDPGEVKNLAAQEPERLDVMTQALDRALAQGEEEHGRAPLDAEAAERLRALGYVAGPGGRGSRADPKDKVAVARLIAKAVGPFGGPADVVKAYEPIAALDPENPLVVFRLADALLRSGRVGESIPLFARVVAGRPRSPDPFVGLATAYARTGKMVQAKKALEGALTVDPGNGQAHFNLGEMARARGDEAEARSRYEKARLDPVTRARAESRLAEKR